jgi:hypothetical protein
MKPLRRIGDHLRRNAYGLLAVFIVLGGGAYAAAKIGPNDIAKNAVRSRHIKAGNVKPQDQGFVPAARYQSVVAANCTDEPLVPTGGSLVLHWGQAFFRTGGVKDASCPNPRSGLVPPRSGIYEIDAGVLWPTDGSGDYREIELRVNGDAFAKSVESPVALNNTAQTVSMVADLSTNETVTLAASHDADTDLAPLNDNRTFLSFHWVGPDHVGPVD